MAAQEIFDPKVWAEEAVKRLHEMQKRPTMSQMLDALESLLFGLAIAWAKEVEADLERS